MSILRKQGTQFGCAQSVGQPNCAYRKPSPDANEQFLCQHPGPRLSCKLQNGIPTVHGSNAGYYHFSQEGKRSLVLNRRQDESIVIDNTIDIVVLEVKNDEVILGIIGPKDTEVSPRRSSENILNQPKPR